MRAAVVRECTMREFERDGLNAVGLVNLIVLSRGVTENVLEAVRISALEHCVVLAAMERDEDGIRDSCAVADCGVLLDMCDSVHSIGSVYTVSNRLRVYDTSAGKIGVLVGDDVLFPEAARTLAESDAQLYVAMCRRTTPSVITMAKSHAVANGIRLLYCGGDCGFASDYTGHSTLFDGRVVTVECALATRDILRSSMRRDCYRFRHDND